MRTLVLSDLHLGCGADPGIFAGADPLAGLLARLAAAPLRVVLNGNTFDFPAQEGDDVVQALTRSPANAAVLAALGRVADRGGELIFRAGRHDAELERADVQAHVLGGLELPARSRRRVAFVAAAAPSRCEAGGSALLIRRCLAADAVEAEAEADAEAAAHRLINSLRRQFGVGLADLLRARPLAAALAGLAVNPTAARHVLRDLPDAPDILRALQASRVFARADLSRREAEVLRAALDPDAVLGAGAHDGALHRARLKLLRSGVGEAAAPGGFPRELGDDEWAAARAEARRHGAAAVLGGHTHAAGWRAEAGLVACDTGAWTWLAHTPAADADDATWAAYLERWQRTPRIDARLSGLPPTRLRLTAALLSARSGGRGARLALIEWRGGEVVRLRERALG
ncbi:MAG: hypothetical protein JNL82_37615 [Myxococcales bacterium]|nr:hypothetical protein [Myxococcales bacterium]